MAAYVHTLFWIMRQRSGSSKSYMINEISKYSVLKTIPTAQSSTILGETLLLLIKSSWLEGLVLNDCNCWAFLNLVLFLTLCTETDSIHWNNAVVTSAQICVILHIFAVFKNLGVPHIFKILPLVRKGGDWTTGTVPRSHLLCSLTLPAHSCGDRMYCPLPAL